MPSTMYTGNGQGQKCFTFKSIRFSMDVNKWIFSKIRNKKDVLLLTSVSSSRSSLSSSSSSSASPSSFFLSSGFCQTKNNCKISFKKPTMLIIEQSAQSKCFWVVHKMPGVVEEILQCWKTDISFTNTCRVKHFADY